MQDRVINKVTACTANKQKGRSMLEVIGVLAVAGVMMSGIIAMTNRVMDDRTNAMIISEVTNVVGGAKSLLSWYTDDMGAGSTTIMKYLLCQGYIRSSMSQTALACSEPTTATTATGILSNGSPINVTGAKGYITSDNKCGNTCTTGSANCHDIISVDITNLTKSQCIALAMTDWGKDFIGMSKVNTIEYVTKTDYSFPLSLGDASAFCGSKTEGTYALTILFF